MGPDQQTKLHGSSISDLWSLFPSDKSHSLKLRCTLSMPRVQERGLVTTPLQLLFGRKHFTQSAKSVNACFAGVSTQENPQTGALIW